MEKVNVRYYIKRLNSQSTGYSGSGYLLNGDLHIPSFKDENEDYLVLFDATKYCRKIFDKENEYKGNITVYQDDVTVYNEERDRYETIDCLETTYYVWYKII